MPFDHAWLAEPQHDAIHKTYLPEDLEPLLRASGVDQAIFVQTQHDIEENRWVLGLAEQNPFLAGVVGWVDLTSDACEDQLSEFKDHPKFVGIRHITQGETDDDFIVRPDVLAGLKVSPNPISKNASSTNGRPTSKLPQPTQTSFANFREWSPRPTGRIGPRMIYGHTSKQHSRPSAHSGACTVRTGPFANSPVATPKFIPHSMKSWERSANPIRHRSSALRLKNSMDLLKNRLL